MEPPPLYRWCVTCWWMPCWLQICCSWRCSSYLYTTVYICIPFSPATTCYRFYRLHTVPFNLILIIPTTVPIPFLSSSVLPVYYMNSYFLPPFYKFIPTILFEYGTLVHGITVHSFVSIYTPSLLYIYHLRYTITLFVDYLLWCRDTLFVVDSPYTTYPSLPFSPPHHPWFYLQNCNSIPMMSDDGRADAFYTLLMMIRWYSYEYCYWFVDTYDVCYTSI